MIHSANPWARHLEGTPQPVALTSLPNYAFQFFFKNLSSFAPTFWALTAVSMASALCGFFVVYAIGLLINDLASPQTNSNLAPIIIATIGLIIIREVLDFFIRKYGEAFASVYSDHLTLRFATTIIASSSPELANTSAQKLELLMSRYIGAVRGFAEEWFWGTSRKIIQLVTIFVILYLQSPFVLFGNLIYLALFLFISFKISKRFAPLAASYVRQQIESGTVTGSLQVNLNIIQRLGLQTFFLNTFRSATLPSWQIFHTVRKFHAWRWLIQLGLYNAGYIATLIVAVLQVRAGTLALGYLVLIKYAFDNLFGCVAWLIEYYVTLIQQRENAALVRDEFATILTPRVLQPFILSPDWKSLTLDNVVMQFNPSNASDAAVTISVPHLHVSKGDKLGIMGPSGAGKTTLLLRLMNLVPSTGSYKLDGKSLSDMQLPASLVQLITNSDPLFPLSLRDNICLGKNLSDSHLQEILRLACIDSFADNLDAVVGTARFNLSAGQQQRVRLARALAHPTDLLLLDEPFNGIDTPTVERLIQNLRAALANSTVIMVTHKESELKLVNRSLTLRNRILQPE